MEQLLFLRKHQRYMVSLVRPIQTSPRQTCTCETNTASQQPIAVDEPRNSNADSNTKSTVHKFRRVPTDLNWSKYRKQRKSVTLMKRRAINDFCADAPSTTPSTGFFCKKVRPLLPKSKSSMALLISAFWIMAN